MRKILPACMLCVFIVHGFGFPSPTYADEFLLNYGSIPNGTGRKVSGVNVADGWTVYQAFDVPAEGWYIKSVGVDGWRVQDPPESGQTGMICPDNGTGSAADCSNPIAVAVFNLGNVNPFESLWKDVPMNAPLPGNRRYWFVSSANDGNYWSSVFHASSGLSSYSIRTSDGIRFDSGPTALRIGSCPGIDCPAVSEWGLAILSLLVLIGGTILCDPRRLMKLPARHQ